VRDVCDRGVFVKCLWFETDVPACCHNNSNEVDMLSFDYSDSLDLSPGTQAVCRGRSPYVRLQVRVLSLSVELSSYQ
jgi:hypothetical protein